MGKDETLEGSAQGKEEGHEEAEDKREPQSEKVSLELPVGFIVRGRWRVVRKLGQGAFGAVYQVVDTTDKYRNNVAALKVEAAEGKNQVIAQETTILRKLRLANARHATHFIASGRTTNRLMNYMIMGMVGRNLGAIKRSCRHQKLSLSSTVRLGKQAFEAIWEVHLVGYLHRDVKPSNFSLGCRVHDDRLLYLFDFGLSRKYADTDGPNIRLRPPRDRAGFRGTVRYSSLTTHYGQELSRADDLISCMYMLVELYTGRLPWRGITDKSRVKAFKEKTCPATLMKGCPEEFEILMTRLNALRYEDTPPYMDFLAKFDRIMERKDYQENVAFPEYRLHHASQPLPPVAAAVTQSPNSINTTGPDAVPNPDDIQSNDINESPHDERKQDTTDEETQFDLAETAEDATQWEMLGEEAEKWHEPASLDTDTPPQSTEEIPPLPFSEEASIPPTNPLPLQKPLPFEKQDTNLEDPNERRA